MSGRPAPLLDSFAAWLSAYGDAWEHADADEMSRLFALGATFQPTPFADLLRGRRRIGELWHGEFDGLRDVQFRAQVLGAGDTYGVAHWRVSFRSGNAATETLRDGVLLAALDGRGLCTSLRSWWHETDVAPKPALA